MTRRLLIVVEVGLGDLVDEQRTERFARRRLRFRSNGGR